MNNNIVKVRFTSFFADVKMGMGIVRVVPRVLNTVSGRTSTVLQDRCTGGKIRFRLGAGIARIGPGRIVIRGSNGAGTVSASGVLIDMNHQTVAGGLNLRDLSVRASHQNIQIGRCVRASRPRICTTKSVAKFSRLTRATCQRNRITIGRVLKGRRQVSCETVPTIICAGPRITNINGARRRLGTDKRCCGLIGVPVACSNHFITRGRANGKLYGLLAGIGNRVVNYRLIKGPTSRVVIVTNVTIRRNCAISRFGGAMFPRPAIKRTVRRDLCL